MRSRVSQFPRWVSQTQPIFRARARIDPRRRQRARALLAGTAQSVAGDPRSWGRVVPNGLALQPSQSDQFAHRDNGSRVNRALLGQTPGAF
jgi:hypothetical protein